MASKKKSKKVKKNSANSGCGIGDDCDNYSGDFAESVGVGLKCARDGAMIAIGMFGKFIDVGKWIDRTLIRKHKESAVVSIKRRKAWIAELSEKAKAGTIALELAEKEIAEIEKDIEQYRKSIRITGCPQYKSGKCFNPEKRCEEYDSHYVELC